MSTLNRIEAKIDFLLQQYTMYALIVDNTLEDVFRTEEEAIKEFSDSGYDAKEGEIVPMSAFEFFEMIRGADEEEDGLELEEGDYSSDDDSTDLH